MGKHNNNKQTSNTDNEGNKRNTNRNEKGKVITDTEGTLKDVR